ncbi:MAG: hypothetical protein WDN50_07920 [Bradyrhizobium sp.]
MLPHGGVQLPKSITRIKSQTHPRVVTRRLNILVASSAKPGALVMRASQFKKKQSLSRLFVSNKCTTAIPVACGLTRDMLIQASLDSSIRQIDYVSSVNIGGRNLRLDTVVISRDDGRFAIEIAEARPPRDIDDEDAFQTALRDIGVSYLAMTAADIRQEPRLSNCRDIGGWPTPLSRLTSVGKFPQQ